MIKNKLDYKLLNYLIMFSIIFIIYETRELWINILTIISNILKPIIISIIISYISNIYLKKINTIFNKIISIIIFITTIIIIIYLIFFKISPIIINQITDSINICIYFIKEFSIKYNINFTDIYNYLEKINKILPTMDISKIISGTLKYISLITIIISLSIYFFIDFDKIKNKIKIISTRNNSYQFIKNINKEIEKYTTSFLILLIINVIEYAIIFKIIGHPNYLLLGIISGILSIIPIFGGMITNALALITASVINYGLFIRTIIGILVLSILDGYIISPLIYKKNNKIHPILTILAIFINTKFFGIIGTITAVPILIIIKSIYEYKKKET